MVVVWISEGRVRGVARVEVPVLYGKTHVVEVEVSAEARSPVEAVYAVRVLDKLLRVAEAVGEAAVDEVKHLVKTLEEKEVEEWARWKHEVAAGVARSVEGLVEAVARGACAVVEAVAGARCEARVRARTG